MNSNLLKGTHARQYNIQPFEMFRCTATPDQRGRIGNVRKPEPFQRAKLAKFFKKFCEPLSNEWKRIIRERLCGCLEIEGLQQACLSKKHAQKKQSLV